METPADALRRVIAVFEQLGIPYMVGGSVASSIHGVARPTMDIDVVAAITTDHVGSFVAGLASEFYVDAEMIHEALARDRPFNLIHYASSYKFDVFPVLGNVYLQTQLDRRVFAETRQFSDEPIRCAVATAEDIILAKLAWYRAGGEISERQWQDIAGVVRTCGSGLDVTYLRLWSPRLGVEDLLDRLLPR